MSTTDFTPLLPDHVAVVTGTSSGLGRATALALARAGADVALIARSAKDLDPAAAEVTQVGRRALSLPLDLADAERLPPAIASVVDAFGRIDVLVNAAGTDVPAAAEDLTIADWDRVQAVNLRAPFVLARAVFPPMRQAGRGTIINISSVAGKRGWANASAYCASKFGLTGLTQAIAAEGRTHGIRACLLYPGGMASNWGIWSAAERDNEEREPPPLTKAMPPADVASLIVWIAAAPPNVVLNEAIISPL
jgi:3-oxoacyl-[acyl-carrier protein] reductase